VTTRAAALSPALKRLAADGRSCFGAVVQRIDPERVIQRAFSEVVRARVITSRGDIIVYCKTFRSPVGDPTSRDRLQFRAEREFRETARAYQALAGRRGFAPLEPVTLYPDLLTLVTKEVTGEPLSTLLSRTSRRWSRRDLKDAIGAASLVGEWLRAYQQMPFEPQRLAIDDLRGYVDARLQRLAREQAGGFTAAGRQRLMADFDACATRLDARDLEAVPVHADFCPDNILVRDGTISVIDFAMAKRGLRHLDLSHLLIHLDFRRGISWDPAAIAAVRSVRPGAWMPSA